MPTFESIVILGPVVLTNREVPDTMPFGGRQAMAIHKNLGGARTIDMMGPDPDPIRWSGLLYGTDAAKRARMLDALKDTGAELRLTWGSFSYLVVMSSFKASYKHEWEIPYQICVEISQIAPVLPFNTISAQIASDWVAALATPALSSDSVSAITNAQTTVNSVANTSGNGDIANVSLADLQPAIAAVETAYSQVSGSLSTAESGIAGVNLDASPSPSILDNFSSFSNEANNVAASSNLRTALGYLGRIVGNLTSLGG